MEALPYNPTFFSSIFHVLKTASMVTSVTEEHLTRARKIANFGQGEIIPNAFDPTVFHSEPLHKMVANENLRMLADRFLDAKSSGAPVVGFTGIIRHKKGYPVLLSAFKKVLLNFPDAILLVVGDTMSEREKEVWDRQISTLGLSPHIYLTGRIPQSQVGAWLREMDVFVLPSLYEGSPNALIEAMGVGLPVVSSRIAGTCSLIQDGESGILVPPGDPHELAEKIQDCLRDTAMRARLGEQAAKRISSTMSYTQEVSKWKQIYETVLDT